MDQTEHTKLEEEKAELLDRFYRLQAEAEYSDVRTQQEQLFIDYANFLDRYLAFDKTQ